MPWQATTPEEIQAWQAVQQVKTVYEHSRREYRQSVDGGPDQIIGSQRALQTVIEQYQDALMRFNQASWGSEVAGPAAEPFDASLVESAAALGARRSQ